MSAAYYIQDPSAVLDYSHDWTDWLGVGDTIATRQWTITPSGPTLQGDTTNIVFVSGLVVGEQYKLTEHITTAAGVQDERTIVIACEHT